MPSTYTGSQAGIGEGTLVQIMSGSPTPAPVTIGECDEADLDNRTAQTVDVTNFQSGKYREFKTTLIQSGEFKLTGNYLGSTDAGQVAVETAFNTPGSTPQFIITLPTGRTATFNAAVTSSTFKIGVDKIIKFDITLKVTGQIVFAD